MTTLSDIISSALTTNNTPQEQYSLPTGSPPNNPVISSPELTIITNAALQLTDYGKTNVDFMNLIAGIKNHTVSLTKEAQTHLEQTQEDLIEAGWNLPSSEGLKPWQKSALILASLGEAKDFFLKQGCTLSINTYSGTTECSEFYHSVSDSVTNMQEQKKEEQDKKEACTAAPTYTTPNNGLWVNLDEKHYQVEKSELEGVRDLMLLAKTSDKEESWMFTLIKNKNGQTRSLWFEIGENETNHDVFSNLDSFMEEIAKVLLPGDSLEKISDYHIHPAINRLACNDDITTSAELYPSPHDWTFFKFQQKLFADRFPKVPFSAFAVDDMGVWTMGFNTTHNLTPSVLTTEVLDLFACNNLNAQKTPSSYISCAEESPHLKPNYLPSESLEDSELFSH